MARAGQATKGLNRRNHAHRGSLRSVPCLKNRLRTPDPCMMAALEQLTQVGSREKFICVQSLVLYLRTTRIYS